MQVPRARRLRLASSLPLLWIALAMPARANLIDLTHGSGAGSFELASGPFVETGPGFAVVPAGSTFIVGWTTGGNGVDYLRAPEHLAAEGTYSVDLARLSAGWISTTIPTVPGTTYFLTFQAYAGLIGTNNVGRVSAGDLVQSFTANEVTSAGGATYTPYAFSFTASETSTVVLFEAQVSTNGFGPVVDDVSIYVPEPGSVAMTALGFVLLGMSSRRTRNM